MKELEIRERCPDCQVTIGDVHQEGCDIDRCPFCGRQMLQDECQYAYFGIDTGNAMEKNWKWVYENGLPGKMNALYEAYLAPHLLVWDGYWPGDRECREYGFWSKMTPSGWQPCDADDPEAHEDLNTLHHKTVWNAELKRRVLR